MIRIYTIYYQCKLLAHKVIQLIIFDESNAYKHKYFKFLLINTFQ